jgi:fimbrial chaperone protein
MWSVLALLGAALVWVPSRPVGAAGIEVQPITVELSAKAPSAMVAVKNRGVESVRFQVTAFAWNQKPSGEMVFEPTQDIMFFPSMMTLNPQEARNLRVGATIKPGALEKTYRLFIQELPRMVVPNDPNGSAVAMLARVSVPVFLQPAPPKEVTEIRNLALAGRNVRFSLRNVGNVHFRATDVELRVKAADGQIVHKEDLRPGYVLAGGEMQMTAQLPTQACTLAKSLEISVQGADRKPPQVALLPNVVCTP